MNEMSFKNKIKRLKQIQKRTSNWTDDKIVRDAINSMEKLQKIDQIIKRHDADSMPEDYFYIDKIRDVLEDDRNKESEE